MVLQEEEEEEEDFLYTSYFSHILHSSPCYH